MIRAVALAAGLGVLGGGALAQDLIDGSALYHRHCAVCHGIEATGDGPMQPVLVITPTDLTQLSAGNGGVFPIERTLRRIDGRDALVSHGSPMPLFGFLYEHLDTEITLEDGRVEMTSPQIVDLVAYLETLQR